MEKLTSKEKAAILLISLGKDYAARLYQYLSEDEIEQLTLSITNIRRVDTQTKESTLKEFHEICLAQNYISEGGIDYAREILEKAIGAQKAMDLIGRLSASLQTRPFDFIRNAEPGNVINLIQNEYPQTIALVLSYLDSRQAAAVLASLPQEKQTEVISRIANMGSAAPEYIKEAERILERRLSSMGLTGHTVVGGIDSIVEILNAVDRSTEKFILESLDLRDNELADEIRSKLFVFEDVAKLSGQAIQRVLKEIDNSELSVALKGTTPEVSKIIFANISKRLQEMLKEDMDLMGPVRVRDVEEAQQKIVNVIRRLEESGEIVIARGKEDEMIV